jgi:hypothetical protein
MKRLSIFILVLAGLLVTASVGGAEQISALLTRLRGDASGGIHNR